MSEHDLEDAFEAEAVLQLYTSRIGCFIEGRVFALHWPVAPDAFLLEVIHPPTDGFGGIYWIQRTDPSLIINPI